MSKKIYQLNEPKATPLITFWKNSDKLQQEQGISELTR